MLTSILASLQWVHLGIDLAWDMFLGMSLLSLSAAVRRHEGFGTGWSVPMALLGVAVIAVNLYALPFTPESLGIFDIGPVIGTFMILFAVRAIQLGLKTRKPQPVC
jgi:hypothetical protein